MRVSSAMEIDSKMSGKAVIKPGMKVAVVSCRALGDTTLFLRLAWRLRAAGAEVTLVSGSMPALRDYLPGIEVLDDGDIDIPALAAANDLVVCYIDFLILASRAGNDFSALTNVAYLAGKKLPKYLNLAERRVFAGGVEVIGANSVICRDPKAGKTMVQWIDLYASEVLGLDLDNPVSGFHALPVPDPAAERRVAIFPTTPHPKKNYSPSGFRRLAKRLRAQGWDVEFVGTPNEHAVLAGQYPGYAVHAFANLKALVDYLVNCSVVISNDSGGGHLGSLLGLRTFTITRRRPTFTWRPGFNDKNQVITPKVSFKVMGKVVWRPFIPLNHIVRELAQARVQ